MGFSEGEWEMSEGDVWSVHEPQTAADAEGVGSGAAPQVSLGRPQDPDYAAWLIAGVLFLLAGVLQAAVLFVDTRSLSGSEPVYDSIAFDLEFGMGAAALLACGTLLLVRRARELAGALATGLGLAVLTGYFWQLRPSKLKSLLGGHGSWLLVGTYTMLALGTVTVLTVVLRRRERVVESRTKAERRADRVVAVVLGFGGAVFGCIAGALAWYRFGVGPASGGGIQSTFECCSWSQADGWMQSAVLANGATIVVLALFAATARSRFRAAGLLLGVVMAGLPDFAIAVAVQVAPLPTFYGIHFRQQFPDTIAVGTATPGFWLGLIGLLLLSAAAVTRLALGSRTAAYPQNELERIAS